MEGNDWEDGVGAQDDGQSIQDSQPKPALKLDTSVQREHSQQQQQQQQKGHRRRPDNTRHARHTSVPGSSRPRLSRADNGKLLTAVASPVSAVPGLLSVSGAPSASAGVWTSWPPNSLLGLSPVVAAATPTAATSASLFSVHQLQREQQYLMSTLHWQGERAQRLMGSLASIRAQLQTAQTATEARQLRKNAGFVQSKLAEAERQERLIVLRLGDVWTEMQRCGRAQQQQKQEQMACMMAAMPLQLPLSMPSAVPGGSAGGGMVYPPPYMVTPMMAAPVIPAETNTEAGLEEIQHTASPMRPTAAVFQPRLMPGDGSGSSAVGTEAGTGLSGSVEMLFVTAGSDGSARRRGSFDSVGSLSLPPDRPKRMSLPPMRSVWSVEDEEEECG